MAQRSGGKMKTKEISEEKEFIARIRLRKVGGLLIIPTDVMKDLELKSGDVVEVTLIGTPTKNGRYTISTTVQKPPSIYLRKLDLNTIGIVDKSGHVTSLQFNVLIKKI
jgi:antitoxin component of MazEF toxin-antitoxin module